MNITGANAIIMLSVTDLIPAHQVQGFATDDVFDTDSIASAETLMGVDGILSAGYVNVPVQQTYALQADSLSNQFFELWWGAQETIGDLYRANGVIILKAVKRKWTLTNGALTGYKPAPDVKRLLQPRRYQITWESMVASPT